MHSLSTFLTIARQFTFVMVLMLFSSAVASAYTIVMRDGRQLEVPANFIVTPSTVTYEVSPGMQITLNILAIDIPATEKINNEPRGSFVRRATGASVSATPATTARTTITNRDLEPLMARRRASEAAYEKRRKELGLPSLEESRRRADAELTTLTQDLRAAREAQQASEASWRERAFALRSEIAAVDAELQYLRVQIDQPTFPYVTGGAFATTVTTGPFGGFGGVGAFGNRGGFHGGPQRARVYVGPNVGASRGQVLPNPFQGHRARQFGNPFLPVTGLPFFGWGQPYDSYERSVLINRFNELSGRRAALNATWRELEDEGRRAGVPPGWLRK